jgi:hypothetical protein
MALQVKTEQEMFPLVEGWLSSGQTQKQFCTIHQMPVHILAYWVGRYRKSQPQKATAHKAVTTKNKTSQAVVAADSASGFIRLSPPAPIPTPAPAAAPNQLATGSIEVVLPTGTVIRFSTTVPAGYLRELLTSCSH